MPDSQREKLHTLLKGFRTAMLITHSGGELRARPMAVAGVDSNCDLWFFSNAETAKVHEIEADTRVHVVCQDDRSSYLSLSGVASLVRDRTKIDALWNDIYKTWFPGGKEDPDLMLIHFRGESGEYWDQEGFNRVKYLFAAAKAYVSGTTPKIEEGEQHGRVAL